MSCIIARSAMIHVVTHVNTYTPASLQSSHVSTCNTSCIIERFGLIHVMIHVRCILSCIPSTLSCSKAVSTCNISCVIDRFGLIHVKVLCLYINDTCMAASPQNPSKQQNTHVSTCNISCVIEQFGLIHVKVLC